MQHHVLQSGQQTSNAEDTRQLVLPPKPQQSAQLSPLVPIPLPGTIPAPMDIAVTPFNSELAAALDPACQG